MIGKGLGFAGGIAGFAALALAPVPIVIASEYLSVEAAQRALVPQADRFEEIVPALTPAERQAILALAGPQPPHRSLRVFRALRGGEAQGFVFVDEVIGKQDFITYALAIDAEGRTSAIEVLAYRESHGGEIRNAAWRRQFVGREGLGELRFEADIRNIAGATLSCEHVTAGARWLVALWQVALRAHAAAAAPPG
ncbi:MAG TPA: FMN-binding protein [Steroidobacteraceae bacterium]|nr:FMN-binding protein [Steroidobacteraceae bacterium]